MNDRELLEKIIRLEIEVKASQNRLEREYQRVQKIKWEIESNGGSINIQKKLASIEKKDKLIKKIRRRLKRLYKIKSPLENEVYKRMRGNFIQEYKKARYQSILNKEIKDTDLLIRKLKNIDLTLKDNSIKRAKDKDKKYDLFISHASEDKDDFARPLAQELSDLGLEVWYDEFTLEIGDSLRKSIDQGLLDSKFGLVILSSNFFKKNWTQYELNGMIANEISGDNKVILPIWHKITFDELKAYSPSLADKLALNSSFLSITEISLKIYDAVKN
ncbi:toll/interleukin-1 receptor domain-containing protein [Ulvibacterium sp.]|uniref:toll/interleukin-1 receptor domain-containing protein n=1 Tax=Ulvibacterium sp. TaxID=2665914 RepID=UPI003BA9E24B